MNQLVRVNLQAFVDQGEVGTTPYRINRDGHPYVPVGDGGVVTSLRLGDLVVGSAGDHAAPGACLIHPDESARHAVVGLSCLGNTVTVRTGAAAGARGAVLGKRGGGERVIAVFAPDVLARLRPGDAVSITAHGQGAASPLAGVAVMNVAPAALDALGIVFDADRCHVGVRARFASSHVGNGIGRPMVQWDVDLSGDERDPKMTGLRLGDLVAIDDLDARFNAGYRRGTVSIGVVVHGASPQPGHGPGVTVVLSGPATCFFVRDEGARHRGLSEEQLLAVAGEED